MNRRDLLLLRTDRDRCVTELSCESLYMQYQHMRLAMDRPVESPATVMGELWGDEPPAVFDACSTQRLFREVGRSLRNADVVRVVESEWLVVDAFRRDVEDLLAAFRRRGGRIEFQAGTRSTATDC